MEVNLTAKVSFACDRCPKVSSRPWAMSTTRNKTRAFCQATEMGDPLLTKTTLNAHDEGKSYGGSLTSRT